MGHRRDGRDKSVAHVLYHPIFRETPAFAEGPSHPDESTGGRGWGQSGGVPGL